MVLGGSMMLERHDLLHKFDEYRSRRIVAACAPAGYGKTVAVMQWLENDPRPRGVFSVDEYDNDFASFCQRFCDAISYCQPNNQALIDVVTHSSFHSAPDKFVIRAMAALSAEEPTVLVLDDLHLIKEPKVLQLLLVIIKRLPDNFQVVLVSRYELPPIFTELLLKGQIAKISMDQLVFSAAEVITLYKKRGSDITQAEATEIIDKTNGWAIAVNAYWLSKGQAYGMAHEYLGGFVQSNVWESWDETVQDFMLRTSSLRQLTPSLCNALTGRIDSDNFLKKLVHIGAFVMQQEEGVYRYHNLFQQWLRQMATERGEGFVNSLLKIEGQWHLQQNNFYNAVDCFIRSKDHEGIATAFDILHPSDYRNFYMNRFISILKNPEVEAVIHANPHLLCLQIWAAFAEGRDEDMLTYIDKYYEKYPEMIVNKPQYLHEMFYARLLDFRVPISKTFELDDASKNLVAKLLSNIGTVPVLARWTMAMETANIHRGIRDLSNPQPGNLLEKSDIILSNAAMFIGEKFNIVENTIKASLLYEEGQLEEASIYAMRAVAANKEHTEPEFTFTAMAVLIAVTEAQDRSNTAEISSMIDGISRVIDQKKAYHLADNLSAFILRRKIYAGNIKAAEEWLAEDRVEVPPLYKIYIDLTTARALIAVDEYAAAITLLEKILKLATAFHRPLDAIETKILMAIAYWKKKRSFQHDAIGHLDDAIAMAYPYNYVQLFINEGAEIAGMLQKLMNRTKQQKDKDIPLAFVRQLYTKARNAEPSTSPTQRPLKFTEKQLAVMKLLCQGYSYEEMANSLDIKKTTLRSHLELIYNKLEVTNMVDAIAKVEAAGLL